MGLGFRLVRSQEFSVKDTEMGCVQDLAASLEARGAFKIVAASLEAWGAFMVIAASLEGIS